MLFLGAETPSRNLEAVMEAEATRNVFIALSLVVCPACFKRLWITLTTLLRQEKL